MKIIIVGPAYPLRGGGMSTFNERLALQFQNEGHDVEIVTFSLQYPKFLFPGKSQISNDEAPANLKIKVLINSINPFTWFKTFVYIKRQQPHLVVFRYWMPFMAPCLGSIAYLLKFFTNTQRVAITDNIVPHEKFPLQHFLTQFFVKSCNKFITLSSAVAQDLSKYTKTGKIQVKPHPLYDNFGKPIPKAEAIEVLQLPNSKKYLLFFGFIRQYKGLHLLLQAMGQAQLKELNICLVVAGEYYEDETSYKALLQPLVEQGLAVDKTGFVPNEMVKYYFSASDLVALPYLHATQSGVTQVAFHFNKPMLVTNVGGLAEVVTPNIGYAVNPEVTPIADAIFDFFTHNRAENMSKNVAIEKTKYSWETLTQAIVNA